MDDEKRERLQDAGFQIGDAADFLGLSAEKSEGVEARLALVAPSIQIINWCDTAGGRERDEWQPPAPGDSNLRTTTLSHEPC